MPDSGIFMCYDLVFLLMSNPAETEKAELDRRWFISDQVLYLKLPGYLDRNKNALVLSF